LDAEVGIRAIVNLKVVGASRERWVRSPEERRARNARGKSCNQILSQWVAVLQLQRDRSGVTAPCDIEWDTSSNAAEVWVGEHDLGTGDRKSRSDSEKREELHFENKRKKVIRGME